MSTVKADLLTNRLGTRAPDVMGAAMAKFFAGIYVPDIAPIVNESLNMASVTDVGVGNWTCTFTTPMLNGGHCAVEGMNAATSGGSARASRNVSSVVLYIYTGANALYDGDVSGASFGTLA